MIIMKTYGVDNLLLVLILFVDRSESEYSVAPSNIETILKFCQQNGKSFVTLTTMDLSDKDVGGEADSIAKNITLKQ